LNINNTFTAFSLPSTDYIDIQAGSLGSIKYGTPASDIDFAITGKKGYSAHGVFVPNINNREGDKKYATVIINDSGDWNTRKKRIFDPVNKIQTDGEMLPGNTLCD
jgi:hypothetical protein